MKFRALAYFFIGSFCLSSCQSKMICPAFQSAFIYNDSTRAQLFAYFDHDSLPSQTVYSSKTKYGIIEKVKRKKRVNQMRIVKMEKVFPEKDPAYDSLMLALNTVAVAENLDLDSLIGAEPQFQYNYNVEQENYMRLFGKYLPQPKAPPSEETEDEQIDGAQTEEGVDEDNLTRKERRRARKEAREQAKEENESTDENEEDTGVFPE